MSNIIHKQRQGTSTNLSNIVLSIGEIGYATDTKKTKMGDGQSIFQNLPSILTDTGNQTIAGTNTFTGTLKAPTVVTSTNDTTVATTKWVKDLLKDGFGMPDYSQMVTLTSADNPYTPTKNGYLVAKRTSTYATISVTNNTYNLNIAHIMCGDSDQGQQTVMVPVNKNEEYAFSSNATSVTFVPAKGE